MEKGDHHQDDGIAAKTTSISVIHVTAVHEHFNDEDERSDQRLGSHKLVEKRVASDAVVE